MFFEKPLKAVHTFIPYSLLKILSIQVNFFFSPSICFTSSGTEWLAVNWIDWNAVIASLSLIYTLLKYLWKMPVWKILLRQSSLLYLLKTKHNPEDRRYPGDSSSTFQTLFRETTPLWPRYCPYGRQACVCGLGGTETHRAAIVLCWLLSGESGQSALLPSTDLPPRLPAFPYNESSLVGWIKKKKPSWEAHGNPEVKYQFCNYLNVLTVPLQSMKPA